MPKNKSCSCCAAEFNEEKDPGWMQKGVLIISSSLILLFIGLYLEFALAKENIGHFFYVFVVLISGYKIMKKGLLGAFKERKFDMNLLMSIAAIGAFLIGHPEEGASVMLLFYIAEFLENYAGERNKNSMAALINIAPKMAIVFKNHSQVQVHVHDVKKNDIIIVKPGDKIPLDGAVIKGSSYVNQASITGESMPVEKQKGDNVFAGTINKDGYLEIKVTKTSDETLLSKIIKLVEEAQEEKSKTERFIDRFSGYYTPIVLTLSFLIMLISPLFFDFSFKESIYRGLILLVISCPCALTISTPVSMVSGITSAARNGILIKGGTHLEEMAKIKAIAFDKTGTLTEGRPQVTDIVTLNDYGEKEILRIAASLEHLSKHPLAHAVVDKAKDKKLKFYTVNRFAALHGKGIQGAIRSDLYYAGNKRFFDELKIKIPENKIADLENQGKTVILIGRKKRIIGIMAVMDKIKESAVGTIEQLKKDKIIPVMITGDNKRTAKAIAGKLGIDEWYAELLPEEKVKIIEQLLEKHKHVAMVGDGVNDAPALAKAHVGIVMGAIGSDAAIETSDIALMKDDLSKINYLFKLSKRTITVVKQNILASISVKGSFAILALFGFITLWMAVGAGDMGLSLMVILNAIRIGWVNL